MMDIDAPIITESNDNWTKITFKPDMKMFHMNKFDDDLIGLMSKRVLEIAVCLGDTVKVELNSKTIPINSFTDYVDLYLCSADRSRTEPLPRFVSSYDRYNSHITIVSWGMYIF